LDELTLDLGIKRIGGLISDDKLISILDIFLENDQGFPGGFYLFVVFL